MISGNRNFDGSELDVYLSQPDGGRQRETWRRFYQAQWGMRRQILDKEMDGGETSLMRLVGLLDKVERKFDFNHVQRFSAGAWDVEIKAVRRSFNDELTPAGVPAFRPSSLRGQLTNIPYHTPDSYIPFLADVIDSVGEVDAIVELGCGYGRNLFGLYHAGAPRVPYFGGELSEEGVALGNRMAALCPEMRASLHSFDHLMPNLAFLPRVGHLFAFTVHSLEQVEEVGESFFRTLAKAADRVTVVHLEPFGYQVQTMGIATERQRQTFSDTRWNRNLWSMLQRMQEDGVLRVDFAALEMFFPADASNPTSVAMWRGL